ncbi:MAG: hypothetical protein WC076_09595 [Terrimicrobiaceae bacterium]|nr:hypothetical protein [Terrimicrobiaceae bacterium]
MMECLERSLSRFAIPGLIRYVVALNALVFILVTLDQNYAQFLELDRAAILHGEVWRLASWIFLPQTRSFFWIIFYLMFTWWLGDLLEGSWGTFRLNAYYFLGVALCMGSALVFGASGGNLFLNLSLFLAVATLAPNLEILLFLIIPVKIKWVAFFSLIFPASVLLFDPLPAKMIVIMCLGNYLLFFAPAYFKGTLASHKTRERRQRFEAAKLPAHAALHACAVCGATELTHPDTEFRVASDGNEYCTPHLPIRRVPNQAKISG